MIMKKMLSEIVLRVFAGVVIAAAICGCSLQTGIAYEDFINLPPEQRIEAFRKMTGAEIYTLVKNSDQSRSVTDYDLISPANAKETIVLSNDGGKPRFDLAWPRYGGFVPESIASIKDLAGKIDVSRVGGDGGHSSSYGRNADGRYPNASQRSLPETSVSVRTGFLDADRYNAVLDAIVSAESKEKRLSALLSLGYGQTIAERFLAECDAWPTRTENTGPYAIGAGAESAGHSVESRYGYYGIAAPWIVGDLKMQGGSGQLDTVFSWGTLCDSSLISDTGTAEIR